MSENIKSEQRALKALGFYNGKIDGQIGPLTLAAMEAGLARVDAAPAHMIVARAELGVSEILGHRHNTRIIEYHAATPLAAKEDEVAWCSAFVCWCMERVGRSHTRSAAARSWLSYGARILPEHARYGDVVVFARGKSSWQGHVAFFVFAEPGRIHVLGGNQSNRVSVAAYGTGSLLGIRR